jgi:hypothetical protein
MIAHSAWRRWLLAAAIFVAGTALSFLVHRVALCQPDDAERCRPLVEAALKDRTHDATGGGAARPWIAWSVGHRGGPAAATACRK